MTNFGSRLLFRSATSMFKKNAAAERRCRGPGVLVDGVRKDEATGMMPAIGA